MQRASSPAPKAEGLGHLYTSARWRKLRRLQLDQEPLCRFCAARGRVRAATICDHITPHKGGVVAFWSGPFQSLCKHCHDSIKQQMERSGVVRGCDTQGQPLDPSHPWQ